MSETQENSPSAGAKPREFEREPNHPGQRLTAVQGASGKWYVVSTVRGPWAHETMVFAGNEDGQVVDYMDLFCAAPPDHEAGLQFAREA